MGACCRVLILLNAIFAEAIQAARHGSTLQGPPGAQAQTVHAHSTAWLPSRSLLRTGLLMPWACESLEQKIFLR